jgi:DNA-binding NtrC family response regulator
MGDYQTDAWTVFPVPGPGGAQGEAPEPGLVLLYADAYAHLPTTGALPQGRTTLGRDLGAEIHLPVNAVSRRHAEIDWRGTSGVLRDLDSRNGSVVDGRRVATAALEDGSEIRIGDAILKVVTHGLTEYSGYRLDGVMVGGAQRRCRSGTSVGGGRALHRIAAHVEQIALAELNVLVLGETGTGKEVVARDLHRMSGRSGAFCAVNCAAIPQNLLESELFGYRRGAFSGADRDKPGLFRAAHGGTLLLDEIGDMPPEAQAKLLRAIERKEVFPLGATAPEPTDVRIVSATHRDLRRLVATGAFRSDLLGRLGEAEVRLPPLRDRKEDLLQLITAFLARLGRPDLRPSLSFMIGALHYDWPLNVRELEACVKRAVALATGPSLTAEHLPEAIQGAMVGYGTRAPDAMGTVRPPGAEPARAPGPDDLRELLARHQGNLAAVARELGKERMQIHRWLRRYGIDVSEYR